jgi:Gpi18-like mannosyltransferase
VGVLARRLYDERVAARAMVLVCVFPGSFVLSFAYAEALLLVLAVATLLLLLDQRWWWAGLTAAGATVTRPNGVALVVACLVAAIVTCRREHRRQPRAFAAVLLAPLGFVAFQLYLAQRTGEALVWFRVQRQAWEEGASFGWTAVTKTWDFTLHPFASAVNTITALCVVATLGLLVALKVARLPAALNAYGPASCTRPSRR